MARLMITTVVVLIVLGVVLATTGVLQFRNTEEETGVTIDKKELKEKTKEAVETTGEAGSKILDKTGEVLHKAAEGLRGSPDDQPAPTNTPAADDRPAPQPDGSHGPADEREPQPAG